jgi:hypothetical protein
MRDATGPNSQRVVSRFHRGKSDVEGQRLARRALKWLLFQ